MYRPIVHRGNRQRYSAKRMTRCGWLAGLLAVPLILVLVQIGTPHGNAGGLSFVSAQAASPTVVGPVAANRLGTLPPLRIPGVAVPFALPSLALPSVPALNIRLPPETLTGVVKALLFWPIAVFTGLAAWLIRLHQVRWSLIAVESAEPDYPTAEPAPAPAQALAFILPPEIITPAPQALAQGADLAARARFVAMTFVFPETSPSRQGSTDWPLQMNCVPTRFTLTLHHAALKYGLEFCNRGAEALGPLIIRADLVAVRSTQVDFATEPMPLCHYLDSLPPGGSVELTGELRLPLAQVAAMRLGTAELLVPLLRLCAESAGSSHPALSVSAGFAIGLPPLSAGGGIQPFRLDSGPGIWRKLTARRMNDANLS